MPIEVKHLPSYKSVGDVARAAGVGQSGRQERLIGEERGFQVANREDQQEFQSGEADKTRAFQDYQTQQSYDQQEKMAGLQAEFASMARDEQAIINATAEQERLRAAKETEEYAYTTQQKRSIAKYNENVAELDRQKASGLVSQPEYEYAMDQLNAQRISITPKPFPTEFPKGQGVGMVWNDEGGKNILTRSSNGDIKLLGQTDKGALSTKDYLTSYTAIYKSLTTTDPDTGKIIYPDSAQVIAVMEAGLAAMQTAEARRTTKLEGGPVGASAEGSPQFAVSQSPSQQGMTQDKQNAIQRFVDMAPQFLSDPNVAKEDKDIIKVIMQDPWNPKAYQIILSLRDKY